MFNFDKQKHECIFEVNNETWVCHEPKTGSGLYLKISIAQCCHDDEFEVPVGWCPFCGYSMAPKKEKKLSAKDAIDELVKQSEDLKLY